MLGIEKVGVEGCWMVFTIVHGLKGQLLSQQMHSSILWSCDSTSNLGIFSLNSITFLDEPLSMLSLPLLPIITLFALWEPTIDLQIGQMACFKSHWSTHWAWKLSLQIGNNLHLSPIVKFSKQIPQSIYIFLLLIHYKKGNFHIYLEYYRVMNCG